MARTRKQKPQQRTPKTKRTFKRKLENVANGPISRRRKTRKMANAFLLSEMERESPSTSTARASPCFYIDTNPSTMEITNAEQAQKQTPTRRLKRRMRENAAGKQPNAPTADVFLNALNNSTNTLIAAAKSTELKPPKTSTGEIITLSPEKSFCATPRRRRDHSHRGQTTAEKVRQKWRKYTKERLKKATSITMAGVSPNKSAKTKATILSLLGDKTNDLDEFDSTIEYDANLLQDLDLVILAASSADYETYTKLLRQEYASMNDESYKQMRLKVLETLLMIPSIFATPEYQAKFEATARNNLKWEINVLKTQGN